MTSPIFLELHVGIFMLKSWTEPAPKKTNSANPWKAWSRGLPPSSANQPN